MSKITKMYGVFLDIKDQEVTSMVIAAVTAYLKSQKTLYKIDYQKGDVCKVKRVVYIMENNTNLCKSVSKNLQVIFPQLEIVVDDIVLHSELEEGNHVI